MVAVIVVGSSVALVGIAAILGLVRVVGHICAMQTHLAAGAVMPDPSVKLGKVRVRTAASEREKRKRSRAPANDPLKQGTAPFSPAVMGRTLAPVVEAAVGGEEERSDDVPGEEAGAGRSSKRAET